MIFQKSDVSNRPQVWWIKMIVTGSAYHTYNLSQLKVHRVVNTAASYSEGPGLKSRPRDPETSYPDWLFLWFSSVPPGKCQDSALKLGYNCSLPNPIHFIIHLSLFRHYITYTTEKVSLNKLQTHSAYSWLLGLLTASLMLINRLWRVFKKEGSSILFPKINPN
jgi:hypothetical protein